VITPRFSCSGDSCAIMLKAPRILNAPIGCRFSHFRNSGRAGAGSAASGTSSSGVTRGDIGMVLGLAGFLLGGLAFYFGFQTNSPLFPDPLLDRINQAKNILCCCISGVHDEVSMFFRYLCSADPGSLEPESINNLTSWKTFRVLEYGTGITIFQRVLFLSDIENLANSFLYFFLYALCQKERGADDDCSFRDLQVSVFERESSPFEF
jgi:hypothetical protein